MNAGLPGTGIGGLFYVLLALLMPVRELYLTLRGRSSRARWRLVSSQFAIASAIIAVLVATQAFFLGVIRGQSLESMSAPVMFAPLSVAAILLGVVLVSIRIWALRAPRPA